MGSPRFGRGCVGPVHAGCGGYWPGFGPDRAINAQGLRYCGKLAVQHTPVLQCDGGPVEGAHLRRASSGHPWCIRVGADPARSGNRRGHLDPAYGSDPGHPRALRAIGISVVANHFGTGYSDLQNLHRLRLDRIKIAPVFVEAMTHDRQAATMVKAFVGIGNGMDIAVSADGVMDEAQQVALAELGCHEIQGLRYGAPIDAAATLALLTAGSAIGAPYRRPWIS